MNKNDDQKIKSIFKQYKVESKELDTPDTDQLDRIYQKIEMHKDSSVSLKLGFTIALVLLISIGSFNQFKSNQIKENTIISETLTELEYDSIIEEQESYPIVDDYLLLAELI